MNLHSYGLSREGRWVGSRALTATEFYDKKLGATAETLTAATSGTEDRYTLEFVKRWLRDQAKSEQTIVWNR